MFYRKTVTVFILLFLQVFQYSSYILTLSEPNRYHLWNRRVRSEFIQNQVQHPTFLKNETVPLGRSLSSQWNWKTTPLPNTKFTPVPSSAGRSGDWTWNEDGAENSEVLAKTLQFKVVDHGDDSNPGQHIYDPYTFQHRYRPAHTQLHVHNYLDDSYPTHSPYHQSHEWQDLRPTTTRGPYFRYAPHHQHKHNAQAYNPHHNTIYGSGEFGSGVAASSPTGFGTTAHGSENVVHSTSHAHASSSSSGFPIPGEGWDAPRQYAHYHHHHPSDYKRKRYRLEVHPGIIAAPIAGLAAFGVAHAFTSKPVLFELGLVDKKKGFSNLHHLHHHHPIPPGGVAPPYIPNPLPQQQHIHSNHPHFHLPHHHHHHQSQPLRPHPDHSVPSNHVHSSDEQHLNSIKYPTGKPNEGSSHASSSKPWWSPFAAMIPRLRADDIERD